MDQDKKSRATLLLCDYASKHPKTQVCSNTTIIQFIICLFLFSFFSLHQLVYQKTEMIYANSLEIYSNTNRFASQSGVSSQIINIIIIVMISVKKFLPLRLQNKQQKKTMWRIKAQFIVKSAWIMHQIYFLVSVETKFLGLWLREFIQICRLIQFV